MARLHWCIAFIALIIAVALANNSNAQTSASKPLGELRVLYVGSERADDYTSFLKEFVGQIESVSRADFQAKQSFAFDVILLDWPQGEETREMRLLRSPLGAREEWSRPTVLLGSAGLNLAVAWKLQGGSGCTCMDPMAYGFRDHEIFKYPNEIQLSSQIRIKTPEAFAGELLEKEIEVLPLVDDYQKTWRAGWCTYSNFFDKNPDVEYFCGGVNHKTPTAAGLWRQGNLLHFGFEQSPSEMNQHGKRLLLNSIAYISRFSQDRPIATTPSVFGGEVARPRRTPGAWLKRDDRPVDWVLDMFQAKVRTQLELLKTNAAKAAWCDENSRYFAPGPDKLLGIDEDLQSIALAFDAPEFFERVLNDLGLNESESVDRSRRLLDRYVPCGPGRDASVSNWRDWHKLNKSYLFALDTGDYCWYVDNLAKSRKVPSSELRGPIRADTSN